MAGGTWKKVREHGRDKDPLLGRGEEKGLATARENSMCPNVQVLAPAGSQRVEPPQHSTLPCGKWRSHPTGRVLSLDQREAAQHVVALLAPT